MIRTFHSCSGGPLNSTEDSRNAMNGKKWITVKAASQYKEEALELRDRVKVNAAFAVQKEP